ncbi:autophagy-related protein 2 homolog B [Hyalella azteca]|uniref:Autophagy-related protein 2 n=1 Tax=Hyalella azteca TaxID=294128 RepID=A0A8B7N6T2_HYAAZ|nr:autophagy-related protein 2 homolog B [Hyalella azteca]
MSGTGAKMVFASFAQPFISRCLNHWLQPYLAREMQVTFTWKSSVLCAGLTDVDFAPDKLNELFSKYNLPFIINDARIDELAVEVHFEMTGYKIKITLNGLKATIIPLQANYCPNLFDSMIDSFYEHQQSMPVDEIFAQLELDSERYKDSAAQETSKKVLLSLNDVVDITFVNCAVRMEHFAPNSASGIALEFQVGRIKVHSDRCHGKADQDLGNESASSSSFSRIASIERVSIYTEEIMRTTDLPFNQNSSGIEESVWNESFHKQDSTPIKIASIHDEALIRISYEDKTNKSLLTFAGTVPDIAFYLSPRQIFLISELLTEISQKPAAKSEFLRSEPLTNEDYDMLERQEAGGATTADLNSVGFGSDLESHGSGRLPHGSSASAWSVPKADYPLSQPFDKEFLNRTGPSFSDDQAFKPLYCQSVASDATSIIAPSEITYQSQREASGRLEGVDTSLDDSRNSQKHVSEMHVDVVIQSVSMVILHEDVIAPVGAASHKELEREADLFFLMFEGQERRASGENFIPLRSLFAKHCLKNHFQLHASKLTLDFVNSQTSEELHLAVVSRIHNMELVECIVEKNDDVVASFSELLVFLNDGLLAGGNPCLNVSFDCTSEIRNTYKGKVDLGNSKTNVSLAFANFGMEIDLSVIDRAEAFFHSPSFSDEDLLSKTAKVIPPSLGSNEAATLVLKHEVNFSCSCSSVYLNLRFPVPDLRPMSDVLTKPVWKRDLRSDVLTVLFVDLDVISNFCHPADNAFDEVRILSRSASVYFQESRDTERYLIGEASSRCEAERVSLRFTFGRRIGCRSEFTQSLHGPKPFYEKNLVSNHKDAISEPLLYPASDSTFAAFITESCRNADVNLEADIPCLSLFLPSKHIYEVIYNRLAYDLLLWQPHSSHPLMTSQSKPVLNNDVGLAADTGISIYHSFSCDVDDDQFMSTMSSVPVSTSDASSKSSSDPIKDRLLGEEVLCSNLPTTKFGLAMKVGEGSIELITPNRDSKGELSPVTRGRILMDVGHASLYVAAGFKGNVNKSYVGVFTRNATLAHHPAWFSELNEPKEMSLVIRRCSPDDLKNINTHPTDDHDMLSLVMNFDFDEHRNVSTMVLSGKLNHASYKYETNFSQDMWLMQLQDMFSVQDYPIQGYEIPEVVNDVHFSFMNCLVTYHPEGFDTDMLLYIGSLILASSLSCNCNTSIFRTIVEDSGVFIRKEYPGLQPIIAQVLNLGVLQLTLRQALSRVHKVPNTELIIVGALVSLITCSDTLAELMKYVSHFCEASAGQGDAVEDSDSAWSKEREPTPVTETDELELQLRRELLAEAINEVGSQTSESVHVPPKRLPSRGQPKNRGRNISGTDDRKPAFNDRCTVLERLQKVDQGKPHEIAIFNNNPWPDKKLPLLKNISIAVPAMPLERYFIKELSFSWKLCYGRALTPESCSPVLSSAATASPSSVSFNSRDARLSFNHPSPSVKRKDTSISRGSSKVLRPMVEITVKKLRYRVEFYGPESMVVCHHQISVKDIEILDLVPASNLRKLLCRYVTEEYPIGEKSDFISIDLMVKKRPNEELCEECDLDISMGNVRMYADQATVTFLMEFFKEMSQIREESYALAMRSARAKAASSPGATVRQHKASSPLPAHTRAVHAQNKPFFKSVVFNPSVVIVIDFEGNFADINSLNELMLALSSANKVTLKLKEINFKRGLLGLDKVMEYLRKEWVDDIYANQKLGLLKMIAPVGLLIEIVGGMWQLVEAPIQQYMKDGNIFRGLMIGGQAFTCRSMAATFGLLGKMFNCMENVASYLMVIVTPTYRIEGSRAPPSDAVAGVCVATSLVRNRVARVTSNIIESTQTERRERGVAGAVSGFARHIPEMVITPPFLATQVTGCILTGLQHQWTPGNEKELQQKYK